MLRSLACLAGALLCAGGALAQRVESQLSRPSPAIDPDAQGRIELEDQSGGEKFDVQIRKVDMSTNTFALWLEDPRGTGTFVEIGNFEADPRHDDRASFERRTDLGQNLPLGAANLAALKDRRLEVRDDGGQAILIGQVPDIASGQTGGPGGGAKIKGEAPLLRPVSPPLPSARGEVEVESQGNESELEIETEDFDISGASYSIWLEDDQSLMQSIGMLEPARGRSDQGRAEFRSPGNGLPFGVTSVGDLVGRRLEIRNDASEVVLEGRVPSLGVASANQRFNVKLDTEPAGNSLGAKGQAKTSWQPSRGRFRSEVRAQAQTSATTAELWLENPSTGILELVATNDWSGGSTKSVRFSWDTTDSQSLPFGVTDPALLLGSNLEVRLPSGEVLLSGNL